MGLICHFSQSDDELFPYRGSLQIYVNVCLQCLTIFIDNCSMIDMPLVVSRNLCGRQYFCLHFEAEEAETRGCTATGPPAALPAPQPWRQLRCGLTTHRTRWSRPRAGLEGWRQAVPANASHSLGPLVMCMCKRQRAEAQLWRHAALCPLPGTQCQSTSSTSESATL